MVRKLRLERGWSQEQLAQLSGLNIRTIQRIEKGHKPGLETLKSLAAVFNIDISQLQSESQMDTQSSNLQTSSNEAVSSSQESDMNYQRRKFLIKAARFAVIITLLFGINLITSPQHIWAWWPALGLGIALAFGAVDAFVIEPLKQQNNSSQK